MNILICGAGSVGYSLASVLTSEGNSVVMVDSQEVHIREVNEELDVQAIMGDCRDPLTLHQAGAEDADMLIAVEHRSEINLVVAMLGRVVFKIPTIVARVWGRAFERAEWESVMEQEALHIDYLLKPEKEVAQLVLDTVRVPGSTEVFYFSRSEVQVTGLRVKESCPLIHTPLRQLTEIFPYQTASILLIRREGKIMTADGDSVMLPGDEVFFVNQARESWRTASAFGLEQRAVRKFLIVGGGNVGVLLTQLLEDGGDNVSVTLVESNRDRAQYLAKILPDASVIYGNILDERVLNQLNLSSMDVLIAVTNSDETNVFGAVLGKKSGVKSVVALVADHSRYPELLSELDIDVFIHPREVTTSSVLQYVRRGKVKSVHSVFDRKAEIMEIEALETSAIVGKKLQDIKLPSHARVGCVVREGHQFIRPDKSTVLRGGDLVIVVALKEAVREVEKVFSVQLDYF
jgi:trk system potassium uptake protein TrkA